MARPSYRAQAMVLRKTKLGEADLIVTMLRDTGEQLRAVAKGARKPSSPFASRLELYSVVDVLLAKGRSLDIVQEARLVDGNDRARRDLEHSACASVIAELLFKTTQEGLEVARLFPLSVKALRVLCESDADRAPAIAAAHALKAFAFLGVRPRFTECAACGSPVDLSSLTPGTSVRFSAHDGGVLCDSCASSSAVRVDAASLAWANAFLLSTFEEVAALSSSVGPAFASFELVRQWTRAHFGFTLKSLEFLLRCGLF